MTFPRIFDWIWRLFDTDTAVPVGPVSAEIAPGYERWPGARPEILGAPTNTILAVPGLDKWSDEDRRAVLRAAAVLGCPVDSLVSVWASESGLNPQAAYGIRHTSDGRAMRGDGPDGYALDATNIDRVQHGKLPFYAVGILQLTKEAHLEGFPDNASLVRVLEWSPAEQIERVAIPLYRKMNVQGATPGKLYMLNFLPEHAGKDPSFVLGDRNASGQLQSRYMMNRGFDTQDKGQILVADVYAAVGRVVKRASSRRMTVAGEVLSPSGTSSAPTVAPSAPAAPASPSAPAAPVVASPAGSAGHLLVEAVRAGRIDAPTWIDVPWSAAGVTLRVSADAVRAPVDTAGLVRLPVSWLDTMSIANALHCVPLTAEVSDLIWNAATVKVDPRPLGEWKTKEEKLRSSQLMKTLEWSIRFSKNLDQQIAGRSGLVATVGKDWIFSPRLALHPHLGVTYGWHWSTGKPIQAQGSDTEIPAHNDEHFDYSQTMRLLQRMTTDGTDVLTVYERRGMPPAALHIFTSSS